MDHLSIRILMDMKELRNKDLAPSKLSTYSLNQALKGLYIGKNTLGKLGELLGASEFIHWLHALDMLYTYAVNNHNRVFFDPETTRFPGSIPDSVKHNLIQFHPIFQKK